MVGKNLGGVDVLSVDDWSWELNNSWLRASVDRIKKKTGTLQIITDPKKRDTFFKRDENRRLTDELTITAREYKVLRDLGYAPDPKTGIVKKIEEIDIPDDIKELWDDVYEKAKSSGDFKTENFSKDNLDEFIQGSRVPITD